MREGIKGAERISEIGYINPACKHAVIGIYDPPLLNTATNWVQAVLTIKGARALHDELERFLAMHDARTR